MKIQNIALATSAIVIATASAAFAGTGVTNRYTDTRETYKTDIDVENIRTETGSTTYESGSFKVETNFPNVRGKLEFDGSNITNVTRYSTDGPDPFVAATYSNEKTEFDFTDTTTVNVETTITGVSDIYQHDVESYLIK